MVKLYTTESINRNVTKASFRNLPRGPRVEAQFFVLIGSILKLHKLLQLWGGWGYMWEYPIAKTFAGARVKTIYAGTSEIMRELISRSIYSR